MSQYSHSPAQLTRASHAGCSRLGVAPWPACHRLRARRHHGWTAASGGAFTLSALPQSVADPCTRAHAARPRRPGSVRQPPPPAQDSPGPSSPSALPRASGAQADSDTPYAARLVPPASRLGRHDLTPLSPPRRPPRLVRPPRRVVAVSTQSRRARWSRPHRSSSAARDREQKGASLLQLALVQPR